MESVVWDDLTIESTHQGYLQGRYSAEALVTAYQQRIQQLDRSEDGPHINATLALNPDALDEAKALDNILKTHGKLAGPLHGICVVVKDTTRMKGLPTTFGSIAVKDFVPTEDATIVKKLKAAGAVILAKTAMPDFCLDFFSTSSLSGHVRNPYDLDRDTGASSSGTGAAVAASLSTIGVGDDSAGSIRIPSANCSLVGLRPTVGLISTTGVLSIIAGQTTPGPMCRTVRDAALLMDVLVGFDETDPKTGVLIVAGKPVGGSYAAQLGQQAAADVRLGVIRELFGDDADAEQAAVNQTVLEALDKLKASGCQLVDVEIPKLQEYLVSTGDMVMPRTKADLDTVLQETAGINISDLMAQGSYPKENVMIPYLAALGAASPYDSGKYGKQVDLRAELQLAVMSAMLKANVTGLVYPTLKVTAPRYVDIDQKMRVGFPANTPLASTLRFPAISVPAGFAKTTSMPVGFDILGPPYSDQHLLNIAHLVEETVKARRGPNL
ncbi:amidase [Xylariales sp. PMI_506]|nr:amidase [Xylariales sp. PMI_506]